MERQRAISNATTADATATVAIASTATYNKLKTKLSVPAGLNRKRAAEVPDGAGPYLLGSDGAGPQCLGFDGAGP